MVLDGIQHGYSDTLHILHGFVCLIDITAIVFTWRSRVHCNLNPSLACLLQYSQKYTHSLSCYERTLNVDAVICMHKISHKHFVECLVIK